MIIPKIHFPFYGLIIVLSCFIGMYYVYYHLKKECYQNKQILLYFIMYASFALILGKMYTVFAYGEGNVITAGLSAYGGLIGVVISSIIFEKIVSTNGKITKYAILSLPLVYGFTKIACSIAGCCGGIPYDGFLKVKYVDVLNIWQFPIQMLEVIVFLCIFIICHFLQNKKNVNYIVLILVSVFKFLLDFLRYEHVSIMITKNQIFSIVLFSITIVVYILQLYKRKRNQVS